MGRLDLVAVGVHTLPQIEYFGLAVEVEMQPFLDELPCLWDEERIEVKGVKPSPLPSTLPTDLLFCFPFRLGCGMLLYG